MDKDQNLTALGEIDDASQSGAKYAMKVSGVWIVLSSILAIAVNGYYLLHGVSSSMFSLLFAIPVILYSRARAKVVHLFMQQFAQEHDGIYEGKIDGLGDIQSKYVAFGHSEELNDVISGNFKGNALRLFNFSTTTGSGKSSHTYTFTVFETQYPGHLIDVVVASNQGMNVGHLLTGMFSGTGLKALTVEGDFNKYYTVAVPEHYEVEALEILTPDTMVFLESYATLYSFEFVAGKLYVFAMHEIKKKTELEAMYTFAEGLTTRLVPRLSK